MPYHVIGSFLVYACVNAFTPGPGNILALSTVTSSGWRRGRPLFFGIFTGYYTVQLLCALFIRGVSTLLPGVLGVIKYVGAVYILLLSLHIARSRPAGGEAVPSASFARGFLLQLVNVKIYLFGLTALAGYVTDYSIEWDVLALFAIAIASIGTLATALWIVMGLVIQRFYLRHYRSINILLALSLLECVYSILTS